MSVTAGTSYRRASLASARSKTSAARRNALDRIVTFSPLAFLAIALIAHLTLPDKQSFLTTKTYPFTLKCALLIYGLTWLASFFSPRLDKPLRIKAPLLSAAITLIAIWDAVTLKFAWLPLPFFPGPDRVLGYLVSDRSLLWISALASMKLLSIGYGLGATLGLVTGISIGWSKRINYWVMPLLKIIGPIPSAAWIPLALVAFPTSAQASIFLIFLSVWFPVAVMTASGIVNVQKSYFDVARTFGAKTSFLVFRVALPAALPQVFTGLFMGLGGAFLTLIVAEMLGVKAGLGWYVSWSQAWAEYAKLYAALLVIALLFSGIITILFRARDSILVWQKGVIRW